MAGSSGERLGEQLVDLVEQGWDRFRGHRFLRRLSNSSPPGTRAARPILGTVRPRLDARVDAPNNGAGWAAVCPSSRCALRSCWRLRPARAARRWPSSSRRRSRCRTSRPRGPARSCSTCRPARRSSPTTTRSRSRRPRTRSSASPTRRSTRSGRPSGSRPTSSAAASRTAASGTGRCCSSGTATRRSRAPASLDLAPPGARRRDRARHAGRLRRRVVLRRAPHRRPAGSPASTSTSRPPLSALTVDRAVYRGARLAQPGALGGAGLPDALAAAGVSVAGGRASGSTAATASRSRRSTRRRSRAIVALDGPRQRQLHRGAPAQAARRAGGEPGTSDGRRRVRARARSPTRTCRSPACGSSTAPGSRSLDRVTAARSPAILERRLERPGRAARSSSPRCRSPASAARSPTGCATPPARGNVLAKTGTTTWRPRCPATSSGRYVFSVLQNGSPVSSRWARRAQDRFATRS